MSMGSDLESDLRLQTRVSLCLSDFIHDSLTLEMFRLACGFCDYLSLFYPAPTTFLGNVRLVEWFGS